MGKDKKKWVKCKLVCHHLLKKELPHKHHMCLDRNYYK
ncbi:hypothetical protein D1BOALGB6SA_7887 [Olavius sp. associated proteobacterium Delta 1]|nr:hypothetical protein D1BOALGB6SA_7887 [Olavius sp. associated proteobacterium Delta 1]